MTLPGETISTGAPGPDEDPRVSPIQVLRSFAGFYIGTLYDDPEMGPIPNTRESMDYYPTHKDAQDALDSGTWRPR